jgi:hypothetical protein
MMLPDDPLFVLYQWCSQIGFSAWLVAKSVKGVGRELLDLWDWASAERKRRSLSPPRRKK